MAYIRTKAFRGPQQERAAEDQPLLMDGIGGIAGIPDVGGTVELAGLGTGEEAVTAASTASQIASIASAAAQLASAGSGVYFGARDRAEARKDKAKEEDKSSAAAAKDAQEPKAAARSASKRPKWVLPVAIGGGGLVLMGLVALLVLRSRRSRR